VATASRDGHVRLWTLIPAARERLPHPGAVHAIAWHPTGARLATASDDGKLRIFDLAADADADHRLRTLEHGRTALSLAWSPDGQRLASAGGSRVRVWSGAGEALHELVPGRRGEDTLAVAWSPSGDLLVAVNDDRLLLLGGGEGPARPVSGPHASLLRLVFAPDGAELATASVRGGARRWRGDLSAGTAALQESGRPPGEVNDLAWCPDGLLALAREDHRVDLLAGDGVVVLERNTGVAAQSVVCDATQLVAGLADGRVRRWWRRGGLPPARPARPRGGGRRPSPSAPRVSCSPAATAAAASTSGPGATRRSRPPSPGSRACA
jgi:WD40 repeat protein